ncbi:MAG TPA: DciA family protein [Burkholderiales bacterium]|nr:DciA family protein [Burkholderiales bacterium]
MPQAAFLLAVRQVLAEALPAPLRRSCAIANYKQGKVIFLADSSAAAARLRLLAPSLVELLGKRGLQVTGLRVDVQPDVIRRAQITEGKSLLLSTSATEALARAAQSLSGGPLKQALDSLVRRGSRR